MKNIVKKGSALVLAATLFITTSGISLSKSRYSTTSTSLSVSAANAFLTRSTNPYGPVTFDESQISVNITESKKVREMYKGMIKDHTIYHPNASCVPFTKAKITVNLKVKDAAGLENVTLTLDSKLGDRKNSRTFKNPQVIHNSANNYSLVFDVLTQGTQFDIKTSAINNITAVCYIEYKTKEPYNYYFIEAKTPAGAENLYIKLRKTNVSQADIKKWAKKLCMYANSLSDVTGQKLDTLYICYDDPENDKYTKTPCSSNVRINSAYDKYGFVSMPSSFTENELKYINHGISWTLLHEMAHSYGVQIQSSKFWYNFVPIYPKGGQDDDFYTNARGLTAIQNCSNLRSTDIWILNNGVFKKGKYNEILKKINISGNEDWTNTTYIYYTFAKKLINSLYSEYDWEVLQRVFAVQKLNGSATEDYDYKSTENINTMKWINKWLNKNYPTSVKYMDLLRMTNFLRRLYKVQYGEQINESDFINFLERKFSKTFIQEVYNMMYSVKHGH